MKNFFKKLAAKVKFRITDSRDMPNFSGKRDILMPQNKDMSRDTRVNMDPNA